jgi:hypothetical protein
MLRCWGWRLSTPAQNAAVETECRRNLIFAKNSGFSFEYRTDKNILKQWFTAVESFLHTQKSNGSHSHSHTALSGCWLVGGGGGWWWAIGESLAVKRGELLLIDSKFERVFSMFFSVQQRVSHHCSGSLSQSQTVTHSVSTTTTRTSSRTSFFWPSPNPAAILAIPGNFTGYRFYQQLGTLTGPRGVTRVFSFKHSENFSAVAEARTRSCCMRHSLKSGTAVVCNVAAFFGMQ